MEVSVNKDENKYTLDIKLHKGAVDKEIDRIANTWRPRLRIKGFRDGKAPLDVVKGKMNRELKAEASVNLLHQAITESFKDHNIKNAGNPVLDENYRPTSASRSHVGRFGLDGSLSFKVYVDAPPEVDVKDYKGVEVEAQNLEYDSWLEKELLKQQVVFGDKKEVKRAAKLGDEVVIDFVGKIDEVPFDGGSHEDYVLVLGSNSFIQGFEEGIVGHKAGEEFDLLLTFPGNYAHPTLAGKEALFECKLKEVYEVTPHEVNDDLALMLSYGSTDEMLKDYEKNWKQNFEEPIRANLYNQIMDKVIERNPFDVPDNWVDAELGVTAERMRLTKEDVLKNPNLKDSIKSIAERNVKANYLLDLIYEKEESIHLTEDDVANQLSELAANNGVDISIAIKQLKEQGRYDSYISLLEQNRAVDFLIENSVQVGGSSE